MNQVQPDSNSKLKKALTYARNRSEFLATYLEDGRCSLSNNLSENAIRPAVVGRKNWLFSDSQDGAAANSLYLTIMEMSKAYKLNLYEYLHFLFSHRPSKNMSDEELSRLARGARKYRNYARTKWSKTLAFRNRLPDSGFFFRGNPQTTRLPYIRISLIKEHDFLGNRG